MEKQPFTPIYVVSGGVGASAEQLVQTVLAQFPDHAMPVFVMGNVRTLSQVEEAVAMARETGGTIAYTLVDNELRLEMRKRAKVARVVAIDLMGPLIKRLSHVLNREPLGRPGLYRQLHRDYFERVAAIEYTMAHDDGKNPEGWKNAEIVLTGVSRTGKTPLSLYLSVLGWKVANVPLVPNLQVPAEFYELDMRRVIGLTIEPGQLLILRQQRQTRLGAAGPSAYIDPESIYAEIQNVVDFLRRQGIIILDVTDRPIETSADEVVRIITRRGLSEQPV